MTCVHISRPVSRPTRLDRGFLPGLLWIGLLLLLLFPALDREAAALEGGPKTSPRRHVEAVLVAKTPDGAGVLYRYGRRRVLVVRGTPREMGLAQGRLLAPEIRQNVRAFLYEWALGKRHRTRAELEAIWKQVAPHVPLRYKEELAGLAEGSGVPLADLRLLHAIPSRFHCTGTAATPAVTRDGKVYHTRSLDYSLDIGETVRPQTNSLLYVAVPENGTGIPHAIVTWAGFVGCVTGMNLAGVSVGEMGSSSSNESFDGVPMIFLLREVLWRAHDLQQAKAIWAKGPRTCGYNFIFCDPDEVCAVETNRSRIRFFGPGDPAEDVAPHYAIPGVVRRCNHYVDPELAATQRKEYDPRKSTPSSWGAYRAQGDWLAERRGRIDAETMIGLLRQYPVTHPCLHQAVMCPTDRLIWVSQANDPARDPLAGAQNQAFYRYDLRALVSGDPGSAEVFETDRSVLDGAQSGFIQETRSIPKPFGHDLRRFAYRLRMLRKLGKVSIAELTYPSPGPNPRGVVENATVHAEVYRPIVRANATEPGRNQARAVGGDRANRPGHSRHPGVVVLHILDGHFYVARLVAMTLAQRGATALFIKLPYYGERRPKKGIELQDLDLPDLPPVILQAVHDIRRGAAWLRAQPEVDPGRVGIVGVSLGGFVAEIAAGADRSFDRSAFVLSGGSLVEALYSGSRETRRARTELLERGWTKEKAARFLRSYEPATLCKGLDPRRILMIDCRQDEIVPPASTKRFWDGLGRPRIVWFDGGHYALKSHVFETLRLITNHFLK